MRVPENDGPGDHTTVDLSAGGLMKTRGVGALSAACCDRECGWRQSYISSDAKVALCPARETGA